MTDKTKLGKSNFLLNRAIKDIKEARNNYLSISTNTMNSDVRDVNELTKDLIDSIYILKQYMGIR